MTEFNFTRILCFVLVFGLVNILWTTCIYNSWLIPNLSFSKVHRNFSGKKAEDVGYNQYSPKNRQLFLSNRDFEYFNNNDMNDGKSTIQYNESKTRHDLVFRKVAFLKVHKAGSSTAQNIFLRYGESRNLTFILSRVREHQYDNVISTYTSLDDKNTLPPPVNKTFDILCCHVLYKRDVFQTYLPGKTAFIGIIREPFEQFLSTMNYFSPRHILNIKVKNPVLDYLKNPWQYEKGISPFSSFTNNRMALEFDFPLHLFNNYSKDESMAYLEKLNSEFHFVMILEYFMESVVMMRRILGWTIKDVLYLKKNSARAYSFVDNTYRYLYENFARLDYDLYNYFYKRLWEQIHNEGIDFQMELLYFRRLRSEVEDFCTKKQLWSTYYNVPASKWSEEFNVTRGDCKLLMMHEMKFVYLIRERQYGEIKA